MKRNHGAKGKPITLYWAAGVLVPETEIAEEDKNTRFADACLKVALEAATNECPIQGKPNSPKMYTWQIDEIERYAGFRPKEKQIREELWKAVNAGKLRYVNGKSHTIAGFYPPELE